MMKMNEGLGLGQAIRTFHEDEEGLETLQVVMIIAVAALALILIRYFWSDIRDRAKGLYDRATGNESESKDPVIQELK